MRRRRAPLLAAYGIVTPAEFLATSPGEAADFARRVGFPVVLKLISPDILHKTDIGGVILNVQDEQAASAGFRDHRGAGAGGASRCARARRAGAEDDHAAGRR